MPKAAVKTCGRDEMGNSKKNTIRIAVKDEEALYSQFSPEAEFSDDAKKYIISKLESQSDRNSINLIVMSDKPIDEDRFKAASANWTRNEKKVFRKKAITTILRLLALLTFGSIFVILSIAFDEKIVELKYSLLPIMGSLALSKAGSILVLEMPLITTYNWLFKQIEKKNVITFEYGNEKDPSSDKDVV